MRNLNNHDFNGRPLRVGVAAGEQGKDDKCRCTHVDVCLLYMLFVDTSIN